MSGVRTRFAPSPTGPLHLGHAFAACYADAIARAWGGTFLLRIEDIDRSRSRAHWERQIETDLAWLGLDWPRPAMRQSERLPAYRAALERLWDAGLLYPCTCRRRDIEEALRAPQEGAEPRIGPDGPVYPGTCRDRPRPARMPEDAALRLDTGRAVAGLGALGYVEFGDGVPPGPRPVTAASLVRDVGDVVLARRDMGTSYHLAVVLDDAAQGITDVSRGADLAEATAIHVLLQRLLDLPTPRYHHHRLIRDAAGKRLAKRDDARAIALYREAGRSPADIRAETGADRIVIPPPPAP